MLSTHSELRMFGKVVKDRTMRAYVAERALAQL